MPGMAESFSSPGVATGMAKGVVVSGIVLALLRSGVRVLVFAMPEVAYMPRVVDAMPGVAYMPVVASFEPHGVVANGRTDCTDCFFLLV